MTNKKELISGNDVNLINKFKTEVLKSSVFFEGALGSRSINMLGVKSLPTLYGTAYTWGTFLGRNTPIIGGAIMYDGLRRIYNKFQNFGK